MIILAALDTKHKRCTGKEQAGDRLVHDGKRQGGFSTPCLCK